MLPRLAVNGLILLHVIFSIIANPTLIRDLLFGMGHLIFGMGLSLFGTRVGPDRQMLRRVILLRQLVLRTINK